MASPMPPSHLTLSDLESQSQGILDFKALYLVKEPSWALYLLLNINRKPHIGSPITPSHLTLRDLECQSQGHSNFKSLFLIKEPS